MKMKPDPQRIPLETLTTFFDEKSDNLFLLKASVGSGCVQRFELDRGLEARFWMCRFDEQMELIGNVQPEYKSRYFTLICFEDPSDLRLCMSDSSLSENIFWDTIFLSANFRYGIIIPPNIETRCVSISFTNTWFRHNVLDCNHRFQPLKQQLEAIRSFSVLGRMSATEKKLIEDLLNTDWKKSFGTFYIKAAVVKILIDVLHRINERESLSINQVCLEKHIPELEKYIR